MLLKIKKILNTLNFAKKSFTKGGFRHVQNYVSGLISQSKNTVNKIAKATNDSHSSLNRRLNKAKFDKEKLEKRYFEKI